MGVYLPRKTSSICVVFDCSARYQGKSLNDHLLEGLDLTSKLTAVLTRFRKERVDLVAGIEKSFLDKITKNNHDYLCFLWWPNRYLTLEPKKYCMMAHLFGAGSSPGCSSFALKPTTEDSEGEFGVRAAETIRKNFYVENALKSVSTEEGDAEFVNAVEGMCAQGGFKLKK